MFKSVPEAVNQEITFELDEKSLQQWLKQLSLDQPSASVEAMFHMVQSINGLSVSPEKKLKQFGMIEARLNLFDDLLKDTYLESNFPLGDQEYNNVEFLVWSYYELARGYADVAEQTTGITKKKQKALAIYLALNCLNQGFIKICEVYGQPFDGFWLLCYRLYKKAEHEKLLDLTVANQTLTIENIFSHILVLQLCSTDQFRNHHIKMISTYLLKYLSHAKISDEIDLKYVESYCSFDLESDKPPFRMLKTGYQKGPQIRYITCVIIAKKVFNDVQKDFAIINDVTKWKLIKQVVNTLGMAQRRKNSRYNIGLDCLGIFNYKNIVDYLYEQKKQTTNEFHDDNTDQNPDHFFENEKTTEDHEINRSEIKILDSSPQGRRILCKSDQIHIKIGEVVGISPDFTQRIELGLVCRLDNNCNKNISLGVKILSLESKIALMSNPSKKNQVIKVLFLPGTKSIQTHDCVLFRSKQFEPGDVVILNVDGRKIIGQLGNALNQTSSVMHTIFVPAKNKSNPIQDSPMSNYA